MEGTFTISESQVAPLKRDIAICDRDHGDLKLLGGGAESEQQCEDIVNTWQVSVTMHDANANQKEEYCTPGSVSIIIRFLGAMLCSLCLRLEASLTRASAGLRRRRTPRMRCR